MLWRSPPVRMRFGGGGVLVPVVESDPPDNDPVRNPQNVADAVVDVQDVQRPIRRFDNDR